MYQVFLVSQRKSFVLHTMTLQTSMQLLTRVEKKIVSINRKHVLDVINFGGIILEVLQRVTETIVTLTPKITMRLFHLACIIGDMFTPNETKCQRKCNRNSPLIFWSWSLCKALPCLRCISLWHESSHQNRWKGPNSWWDYLAHHTIWHCSI